MTPSPDLQSAARTALRCLDLASLKDADTAADLERLSARAPTPPGAPGSRCTKASTPG